MLGQNASQSASTEATPGQLADASRHADAEALLAALPAFAQDEFRRRTGNNAPPASVPELFEAVSSWLISAGIAEGRGGYPGGRDKADWTAYVVDQQRNITVFLALVEAFGEPPGDRMAMLRSYQHAFPPAKRLMGEGYEAHVDDEAGRLIYSLPVDSGFVSLSFAYPIKQADLDVLLTDPYRRAVLEVVAHTVLQRSMIRGNPEVSQLDFGRLVDRTLHACAEAVAGLVAEIDRDHHMSVDHFVREALQRRSTGAVDGKPA
ncbi:hypothetical protein [Polymorphobacter megasporae]|uniref:hypothetical protein n=1 Tax=Glacieibacterium megasporae TaxID=2835787 RepID=UPI001C1E7BF8|nr:hypothetical protein [Polymorphobacter megasporae]UAJ10113.1 hypothetical protein KTC28_17875 [Polymorphobacter megasporae]